MNREVYVTESRRRLGQLVAEGLVPAHHLKPILRDLRRQHREAARREELREEDVTAWRLRQEESRYMAPVWANFVMAHCPALADLVIFSGLPLRYAADQVMELTGCDPDGCDHRTLSETTASASCASNHASGPHPAEEADEREQPHGGFP